MEIRLFSIIFLLLAPVIFRYCPGEGNEEFIKKDTTNLFNKLISLEKKIPPTKSIIQFNPPILHQLAEPSIIYLSIQHLNSKIEIHAPQNPLDTKMINLKNRVTMPKAKDTLISGLIQHISLDKSIYKQGEIARLTLSTVLPIVKPEINFLNKSYKLYVAGENTYQTILGVPMDADTGRHYLTLKYSEGGTTKSLRLPFRVIAGDFAKKDTVELDIHILTEETFEMLRYENRYFSRAYAKTFDTLLCDGDFIWPCEGLITSLYGMARCYNNDLAKWSHKAIDIANQVGTKILAANSGIVVMAEELEGHGKSIVIAHGQQIHTVYIHLDKIYVAKGDKVIKGQEIGEMGKTGMCTGPNLHFQVMVNRTPTDPRFWILGGERLKKGDYVSPVVAKK